MAKEQDQTQKVNAKRMTDPPPSPHTQPTELSVLGAAQRAEVELAVQTAKTYPRDITKFKNDLITQATCDVATATACMYALPRGGGTIPGESIRLAEIAMTAYGNLIVEGVVTGEDAKFVYATGMCRDLEKNVAVRRTVRRRITKSDGTRYGDNEIVTQAAAATSIAIRNAVFTIIPKVYITPVYEKCREIAVGKAASLQNRINEVLVRLLKLGVSEARILHKFKIRVRADISADQVADLISLGTAIHEGDTNLDEAFPLPRAEKPQAKPGKKADTKPDQQEDQQESENNDKPAQDRAGGSFFG